METIGYRIHERFFRSMVCREENWDTGAQEENWDTEDSQPTFKPKPNNGTVFLMFISTILKAFLQFRFYVS